jgi:hypothetical protein
MLALSLLCSRARCSFAGKNEIIRKLNGAVPRYEKSIKKPVGNTCVNSLKFNKIRAPPSTQILRFQGLFGVPGLFQPSDFERLGDEVLAEVDALKARISIAAASGAPGLSVIEDVGFFLFCTSCRLSQHDVSNSAFDPTPSDGFYF